MIEKVGDKVLETSNCLVSGEEVREGREKPPGLAAVS